MICDDEKIRPLDARPDSILRESSYIQKLPPPIYGNCQACKVSVHIPDVLKLPELRSFEGVCERCQPTWKSQAMRVTYGRFLKPDEKALVEEFLKGYDRR